MRGWTKYAMQMMGNLIDDESRTLGAAAALFSSHRPQKSSTRTSQLNLITSMGSRSLAWHASSWVTTLYAHHFRTSLALVSPHPLCTYPILFPRRRVWEVCRKTLNPGWTSHTGDLYRDLTFHMNSMTTKPFHWRIFPKERKLRRKTPLSSRTR